MCLRGWFQDLLQTPNSKDAEVPKSALCICSSTSRDSISSRSHYTICIYWWKKIHIWVSRTVQTLVVQESTVFTCLFSSPPTGLKVPWGPRLCLAPVRGSINICWMSETSPSFHTHPYWPHPQGRPVPTHLPSHRQKFWNWAGGQPWCPLRHIACPLRNMAQWTLNTQTDYSSSSYVGHGEGAEEDKKPLGKLFLPLERSRSLRRGARILSSPALHLTNRGNGGEGIASEFWLSALCPFYTLLFWTWK